jgi:hypothetical protein
MTGTHADRVEALEKAPPGRREACSRAESSTAGPGVATTWPLIHR